LIIGGPECAGAFEDVILKCGGTLKFGFRFWPLFFGLLFTLRLGKPGSNANFGTSLNTGDDRHAIRRPEG
jgi:hypothetical protein